MLCYEKFALVGVKSESSCQKCNTLPRTCQAIGNFCEHKKLRNKLQETLLSVTSAKQPVTQLLSQQNCERTCQRNIVLCVSTAKKVATTQCENFSENFSKNLRKKIFQCNKAF